MSLRCGIICRPSYHFVANFVLSLVIDTSRVSCFLTHSVVTQTAIRNSYRGTAC